MGQAESMQVSQASRFGRAAELPRAKSRAEGWLEHLIPRRHQILGDYKLTQRNIYVLPTRSGLLYALVLLVMLIAAINYQLALGYALTFLLASIAIVAMMHTYRNVSQLIFRPGRSEPVFAGQFADWSCTLVNTTKSERFAIHLLVPGSVKPYVVDVPANSEHLVTLGLPTDTRGMIALPRFSMKATFPLGLWRAWSYWKPLSHFLVYPQPELGTPPLPNSVDFSGRGSARAGQQDDISALRPYREGDHPRLIAWKAVARLGTEDLLCKEMDGGEAGELLLDWWQMTGVLSDEQKISRLTRWVLDAEKAGLKYGLRIPGRTLNAGYGPHHQAEALEMLALFGS
jgi:uncharacterized protein (DUF58 family)